MCDIFDERYSHSTRYIKRRVSDTAALVEVGDETSDTKFVLKPAFWNSILAGGIAGIVVDFSLYPLDTIKTRLQSDQGFRASGGFKKLYKGVIPVLLCSAPVSALFFCVYNSIINVIRTEKTTWDPLVYVIAASAAEVLCSTIRVPLEVLKQRKQTSDTHSLLILRKAVQKEGFLGLYRGFSSTIAREVPFACIQFPLWEYMIEEVIIYQNGAPLSALQTAVCGAIAGGVAGAVTTPMDVVKTRVMLAEKDKIMRYKPRVYQNIAIEVYNERGISGFFSGLTPRILWIMLGGFIYFGTYEEVKLLCEQKWCVLKWRIQKFGKWLPLSIKNRLGKLWEHLLCAEFEEQKDDFAPSLENTFDKLEGTSLPPIECLQPNQAPDSAEGAKYSSSKLVELLSGAANAKEILRSKAPDPGAVSQELTKETFRTKTVDFEANEKTDEYLSIKTTDPGAPLQDEKNEASRPSTPDPDALLQDESLDTLPSAAAVTAATSEDPNEDKTWDVTSYFAFFWGKEKPVSAPEQAFKSNTNETAHSE